MSKQQPEVQREEKPGEQEHNGMWCCCHNETMLADKPSFISWLLCKSPKYGEEKKKKGRTSETEKQREEGSERLSSGLAEENS